MIFKPASNGYEDAPAVILQGHLDMVCAKAPDCSPDMDTEGVRVAVDGDWVYAEGTSLGGDNGIAVAMALAILSDDMLPHPALEVVLTTDEETGLNGAFALDTAPLQGRRMLNLDSEEEGILTVSCAGGLRADGILPICREQRDGLCISVAVSGLLGGHSGVEIHKGRANAMQVLGRVLHRLYAVAPFAFINVNGGVVDNALPLSATAELVILPDAADAYEALVREFDGALKAEFASTDPAITVSLVRKEIGRVSATDTSSTDRILFVLTNAPTGVQVMSADIPGLVQTSLNFGVVRLTEQQFNATFSVRSSIDSQKQMLRDRLLSLFTFAGGHAEISGEYPGWAYRKDSPLRDIASRSFAELFGYEPKIEAIHAGLECGVFSDKIPDLDCISFGPNMRDVHTANERLSISSVERIYRFVLEILKNCR